MPLRHLTPSALAIALLLAAAPALAQDVVPAEPAQQSPAGENPDVAPADASAAVDAEEKAGGHFIPIYLTRG